MRHRQGYGASRLVSREVDLKRGRKAVGMGRVRHSKKVNRSEKRRRRKREREDEGGDRE